jgi:hypothetical protein
MIWTSYRNVKSVTIRACRGVENTEPMRTDNAPIGAGNGQSTFVQNPRRGRHRRRFFQNWIRSFISRWTSAHFQKMQKCRSSSRRNKTGCASTGLERAGATRRMGRRSVRWVLKAYSSAQHGATTVCLLPSRTDTRWWHEIILPHAEVRFLKGRLKFGGVGNSAPFPSVIAIFKPSATAGPNENQHRSQHYDESGQ